MIIALPYEEGEVFQHFGKALSFIFNTIENSEVMKQEVISTNGSGHSELITFLTNHHTDVLICGGIGKGAVTLLKEQNITIYAGYTGDVNSLIKLFISNRLVENSEANCNHHHDSCTNEKRC